MTIIAWTFDNRSIEMQETQTDFWGKSNLVSENSVILEINETDFAERIINLFG